MDIRVLVDFEILGNHKVNKKQFDENMEMLKKIISIYKIDLLISSKDVAFYNLLKMNSDKINIYIEEKLKDKENLIAKVSKKHEWVLYFKNDTQKVECNKNVIYSPINLRGDISKFKDISFTEHAKNKKYYHDFSNYYMYTLANDTEKEGQFLINCFQKYLNKNTGKVLDCCCGVGRHAYIMAQNGFKVTGIDFSKDQIENARKIHHHDNIDYKIMDIRNFDIEDKDFDMSYCMWTTYNYLSLDNDLKKFVIANYHHQKKGAILILDSKNIPRLDDVNPV